MPLAKVIKVIVQLEILFYDLRINDLYDIHTIDKQMGNFFTLHFTFENNTFNVDPNIRLDT